MYATDLMRHKLTEVLINSLTLKILVMRSRGEEGVWFGRLWVTSLLFADDVVLLASSSHDLHS